MSGSQAQFNKPTVFSPKRNGKRSHATSASRNSRIKTGNPISNVNPAPSLVQADGSGIVVQDESGVMYRIIEAPADFSENNESQHSSPSATGVHCLSLDEGQNNSSPSQIMQHDQQYHLQAVDSETGQQYFIVLPSNAPPVLNEQFKHTKDDILLVTQQTDGPTMNSSSICGGKRETERRSSHNEVEKRRRDKINTWVNKLAEIVPLAAEDNVKNLQFKSNILAKTVDYIYELRSVNAHYAQAIRQENAARRSAEEDLRARLDLLTRQNEALCRALLGHGLPLPLPPAQTPSPTADGDALGGKSPSSSTTQIRVVGGRNGQGQSSSAANSRPATVMLRDQTPPSVPTKPIVQLTGSCNARLVACGGTLFLLTGAPTAAPSSTATSSTTTKPSSPHHHRIVRTKMTSSIDAKTPMTSSTRLTTSTFGVVGTANTSMVAPSFDDSSTPELVTSSG